MSRRVYFLFATVATLCALCNSALAADKLPSIAKAENLPDATAAEVNAVLYMAAPAKQQEAWESKATIRQIVEERFTLKQWDATHAGLTFTAEEQAYIDYLQAVNRLKAGLDVAERRRMAEIESNSTLLRTRAKEIFLDNPRAYDNPEQANVSVIVINTTKRDWRATQAHIAAIKKALSAKKADFAAVAKRFTDDVLTQQGKQDVTLWVTEAQAERPMRNKLFVTMNPGDVTDPMPTTAGLVIVKLNERQGKTPRTFEEVEQQIVTQLLDEQSKAARRTLMAALALPTITYAPEWAPEKAGGPDFSAIVLKIVEQGAREGKSQEEINRLVKQAIDAAKEKK